VALAGLSQLQKFYLTDGVLQLKEKLMKYYQPKKWSHAQTLTWGVMEVCFQLLGNSCAIMVLFQINVNHIHQVMAQTPNVHGKNAQILKKHGNHINL